MLEAEFLPPARDDFDESYAWYHERDTDAAERFTVAIDEAVAKLCGNPTLGIRLDDDHCFYRLKKSYPFYLVYRTESTKLVVVAIAHNRRAPGYWKGR
jgi:plasmid stabilization system protein ParE